MIKLVLLVLSFTLSFVMPIKDAAAQDLPDQERTDNQIEQEQQAESTAQKETVKESDLDTISESLGPVLRLQDTIRGNKEQPQVLTIVPWQLPTHKRIDASTKWQPIVDKLAPIERRQFLKNIEILQLDNNNQKDN